MSDTLQRTSPAERLEEQHYLIANSEAAIKRIEAHQSDAQAAGDVAAYMQYEMVISLLKKQLVHSTVWADCLQKEVRNAH